MISAGKLIWISCRPLIRLVFCVSSGFAIAKADIFPPVAAAGAGQILLNITLPCLMFSKIVPAFTADNISALGPLILVALLYEALGFALALIIKQFFWVPHRFRYGILVAGGWGNVGDIPTAVVMSITGAAPFGDVNDQNLAVAYISAFILVFMVTLFPFGGHKLVAWDFQGPDVEPEEVREAMRLKRKAFLRPFTFLWMKKKSDEDALNPDSSVLEIIETISEKKDSESNPRVLPRLRQKHVSFRDDSSTMVPTEGVGSPVSSPLGSPSPTEVNYQTYMNFEPSDSPERNVIMTGVETTSSACKAVTHPAAQSVPPGPETLPMHTKVTPAPPAHVGRASPPNSTRYKAAILEFLKALLTPSSMTILISFPIALISKLKALFIQVPGTYMPSAPDGLPPLNFVLDATSFVGAASVPLGLVCLGSSLARLNMPRKGEWKNLPLGAISWIAIAKMIIMPVLGVIICEGLTNVGVISREDKVLRFVCIFFSCLPTATVHVLLTQVYSGTGSAEHLSPFLIPQYILMFISMTALTAYTIQLIF